MNSALKIWVDADACPRPVRDILLRAAERSGIETIFVANRWMSLPPSSITRSIVVEQGPDVADARIVELCAAGDLVVTADIPLAALAVKKGAVAINPRGELYTAENIGQILSMRDFMDSLRGSGIETGRAGRLFAIGPSVLRQRVGSLYGQGP